jgi:5'-nucleotidase
MKLLLTNDDGIEAPGLQALFEVARQIGEPIVVAPEQSLSGCSHQVTTDQPIRVRQVSPCRFAVRGTPADCVRVGLQLFVPDAAWVLSGINAGGNLGADVYHSGTVAAARESVLHGWPAIALSHYRKRGLSLDWDHRGEKECLGVGHAMLELEHDYEVSAAWSSCARKAGPLRACLMAPLMA